MGNTAYKPTTPDELGFIVEYPAVRSYKLWVEEFTIEQHKKATEEGIPLGELLPQEIRANAVYISLSNNGVKASVQVLLEEDLTDVQRKTRYIEQQFRPIPAKDAVTTKPHLGFKNFLEAKRGEGLLLQKVIVDGLVFSETTANLGYLFVDREPEGYNPVSDWKEIQNLIEQHAQKGFRFLGGLRCVTKRFDEYSTWLFVEDSKASNCTFSVIPAPQKFTRRNFMCEPEVHRVLDQWTQRGWELISVIYRKTETPDGTAPYFYLHPFFVMMQEQQWPQKVLERAKEMIKEKEKEQEKEQEESSSGEEKSSSGSVDEKSTSSSEEKQEATETAMTTATTTATTTTTTSTLISPTKTTASWISERPRQTYHAHRRCSSLNLRGRASKISSSDGNSTTGVLISPRRVEISKSKDDQAPTKTSPSRRSQELKPTKRSLDLKSVRKTSDPTPPTNFETKSSPKEISEPKSPRSPKTPRKFEIKIPKLSDPKSPSRSSDGKSPRKLEPKSPRNTDAKSPRKVETSSPKGSPRNNDSTLPTVRWKDEQDKRETLLTEDDLMVSLEFSELFASTNSEELPQKDINVRFSTKTVESISAPITKSLDRYTESRKSEFNFDSPKISPRKIVQPSPTALSFGEPLPPFVISPFAQTTTATTTAITTARTTATTKTTKPNGHSRVQSEGTNNRRKGKKELQNEWTVGIPPTEASSETKKTQNFSEKLSGPAVDSGLTEKKPRTRIFEMGRSKSLDAPVEKLKPKEKFNEKKSLIEQQEGQQAEQQQEPQVQTVFDSPVKNPQSSLLLSPSASTIITTKDSPVSEDKNRRPRRKTPRSPVKVAQ